MDNIMDKLREKGILERSVVRAEKLKGGTASTVYALYDGGKPVYALKLNDPATVEAEFRFLSAYAGSPLLPQPVYADPGFRYFVYRYLPGDTVYRRGGKRGMLTGLVDSLINRYKRFESCEGYGHVDSPQPSWRAFLHSREEWALETIADRLPEDDHRLVRQFIASTAANSLPRYYLHGDCGVHNFLFGGGKLTGVIDPTPVAGEPMYDLIYAFCSSPDDLDEDTFQSAVSRLDPRLYVPGRLNEEVLTGLYFRIATCLFHHPHDYAEYAKAWEYWKSRAGA
ncbi:aminoglycoside phosphotransferase family protein [Paenibacillus humicola]|uniref:aminoglycoside phosphotransferase family protein n=1 Tax=Paenibacillus humicola TaxID=3110540 RepID=UPI00237B3227|nr:aminoglycoside phosphotransferase family protein [Paenibacillus humicola]